jgi:hypothetical protein
MQKESSMGTAGVAVNGAHNNWLGITGTGDAGTYVSGSGRNWAVYSSVEASIRDWAGPRVLRNGYYDDAFFYLDPNNYNLDMFLQKMLSHYAPSSDGNNEEAYRQDILSFINGPIAEVRAEMGWPSSAEFAKNENIQIGGNNPINGKLSDDSIYNIGSVGCFNYGNGDITETAIVFSWDGINSHLPNDPVPEYFAALQSFNFYNNSDSYVRAGASCDAFVTTVMRASGADPDFPCCGTSNQLDNYLVKHPEKYQEIENIGNTSNLQSGDIFIVNGHIFLYIVENGTSKAAHASRSTGSSCSRYAFYGTLTTAGGAISSCARTGERGTTIPFEGHGQKYRIFRRIK